MATGNRKKATAVLLEQIGLIDKHTDADNVGRYKRILGDMSDTAFDDFMRKVRDGVACIYIYIPNMHKHPSMNDNIAVAKKLGLKLFERIMIYDDVTGESFLTPNKHLVARIPIRRTQQWGEHKMSIPEGDSKTDALTGQVVHEDRAAGITGPEIQSLKSKGLDSVNKELVAIRGGNIDAWQTGFKKQAEETGHVVMDDIPKDSKNRTVVVAQVIMEAMHFENNIAEG